MAGEIYIGLMTGTSADSLDCAAVEFSDNELNIIGLKNYDIPSNIKEEISENTRSKQLNENLIKDLDLKLGKFCYFLLEMNLGILYFHRYSECPFQIFYWHYIF